ncbi:diguanylate cyclase [Pseudaquabacterium rugosum]|uniref:Diguanylate cyclase n=1 Tax=Pseudaquabacterium rugosum TaxID=2984194 RepID=A0ABU9B456_9BURK
MPVLSRPSRGHRLLRHALILSLVLLWWGLLASAHAQVPPPAARAATVRLPVAVPALALPADEDADTARLWPHVRLLAEPAGSPPRDLSWALARAGQFRPAGAPVGNLGAQRQAWWVMVPLRPQGADGPRIFHLDYAPLQAIDLVQLRDGVPVAQHRLGGAQAHAARPLPSRAHAVSLHLRADHDEVLLLRVQTDSAMLLPMALLRPAAFLAEESAMQALHGLLAGISVALLLYALAYWVSLGEAMFGLYAGLLVGVGGFFAVYFGLAQQYLWPGLTPGPLLHKLAPLSVLFALCAGAQFIICALQLPATLRLTRWLHAITGLTLLTLALSVAGVLDYRMTQLAATVMGPLPMLLAMPHGIRMARTGHAIATQLVAGWSAYTTGALIIAGLLWGGLPADFWLQHAFQFASMLEMLLWMRVLGLRIEAVRRDGDRARLEQQNLLTLAHTDALTGLPNRRGLQQALEQALAPALLHGVSARGPVVALAVFLLDLDGFKPVNDRHGHDAGDALLVQVGQRLRAQLRAGDLVARLGGDEFVIMARGLGGDADARRLGEKLLRAFDEPFVLGADLRCRVGLTVGYALAPQDGDQAGDLLKRADAAMYAGKQAGRHCVRRGAASPGLAGTAASAAREASSLTA